MRSSFLLCVLAALAGCGGPEGTPKAAPPPARDPDPRPDRAQVLDAIIRDVLVGDFLKGVRADYGTPGGREAALVSNPGHGIPWPEGYRPAAPEGYRLRRVTEGRWGGQGSPRMLGIRIDRLDLDANEAGLFRESIEVTVMDAGGTMSGGFIGGCSVYYVPVRKGGVWGVQATRLQCP